MTEMLHKISNVIWVYEKTPKDWARMLVTPIHKKGDKLNPGNNRAISLLFIPGKIFSRILLNRMKVKTEATGEGQFFFRPGRGTVDAIFIARQVIEKAKTIASHYTLTSLTSRLPLIRYGGRALWKMMIAICIDPIIVPFFSIFEKLHLSTSQLENACQKWGMKINGAKRKIISPSDQRIIIWRPFGKEFHKQYP